MKSKLIFVTVLSGLLLACNRHPKDRFTGVGIVLGATDHAMRIVKVLPDTPAAKGGLSSGLVVYRIDDTATDGKNLKDCVDMLRGAVGTKVKLELIDTAHGKTNTIELTREEVMIAPPKL